MGKVIKLRQKAKDGEIVLVKGNGQWELDKATKPDPRRIQLPPDSPYHPDNQKKHRQKLKRQDMLGAKAGQTQNVQPKTGPEGRLKYVEMKDRDRKPLSQPTRGIFRKLFGKSEQYKVADDDVLVMVFDDGSVDVGFGSKLDPEYVTDFIKNFEHNSYVIADTELNKSEAEGVISVTFVTEDYEQGVMERKCVLVKSLKAALEDDLDAKKPK